MRLSLSLAALPWLAICLAGGANPSAAGEAAWQQRPHVALRLSAAGLDGPGGQEPWAAVELRLDPGWKIYWRSPGETGIPTTLDWFGSENLRAAETHWPRPKRARIWDADTIGYGGKVTFPAALRLVDPRSSTLLRVRVAYGVCREICIRDEAVLTVLVQPGGWEMPDQAARIRAALASVPERGREAALLVRHAEVRDGRLQIDMESADPVTAPDLFIEGPPGIRFGSTVAMVDDDRHRVRFEVPLQSTARGTFDLVLTFVDGPRAFERRVTLALP